MFGYVKPRHADLVVREHEFYRAAYCGVCRAMRKETGFLSSFSLSYDAVFLALCRMLATDRRVCCKRRRCVAHPLKKRPCLCENEALSYAARAFALLAEEKLADDRKDARFGKRLRAWLLGPLFRRGARRARLGFLRQETMACLDRLHEMEKASLPSVDAPADEFGDLLGLVFAEGLSEEQAPLFYDVGYHLGRFIYVADAADDYAADRKSGDYNPFVLSYPPESFEGGIPDGVRVSLRLTLTALGEAIEKLPFGGDKAVESIIKNTVYLGLADRVDTLGAPKKKGKEHDGSL
ncbi:MAG: hypothetical protein J6W28_01785 [Clostridia bacterium]|nr:hypothetical protein [Clostridia bacterium]